MIIRRRLELCCSSHKHYSELGKKRVYQYEIIPIRPTHNSLMWSIRAEMKINNKQEALMAHTIAPLEVDHASISIVMDNSIDLLMSSTVE